ncbi:relaxase/mobilization nuclease domain-containing protein [Brevundimonas diminuta]|uniref:relaxase/mobilization nuclease domain-containing protein n=1 Tax=Brevundimonas diminuta TaxID=293 RepID=UPI0012F8B47D|nr:relaxase/mobilization nuclease domain-containing protein [Brevundimonas diminuta]
MTDLRRPLGFEEALRPPVDVRRARITRPVLRPPGRAGDAAAYAQLARIIRRAPEVMVKVTGSTRDGGHLHAHLDYISRNGRLVLEGPDGDQLEGRGEMRALASDWAIEATLEPGGRRDRPLSRSIILSMPRGTDPIRLHDAARAFAKEAFGERFPYVFALHDEGGHPHVHLTVRTLGSDGTRLNPRKADLEVWRQRFAQALRDRGVEAEASPRRARGVLHKGERTPVRKMRERYVGVQDEARILFGGYQLDHVGERVFPPWEMKQRDRRARIRRALSAEALVLSRSGQLRDRALGLALAEHLWRTADVRLKKKDLQRPPRPDDPHR